MFHILEILKLLLKLKIDTIFLSVKGQEQLFFQNWVLASNFGFRRFTRTRNALQLDPARSAFLVLEERPDP